MFQPLISVHKQDTGLPCYNQAQSYKSTAQTEANSRLDIFLELLDIYLKLV